ncbi:MAG: methionine aminopeptidase [Syntrophaceae bacterium PtaU1.Bin231]|nr:MAG: methionine aminopeptidase [Syntrophaceae bacterium PtaU1.Bin231]HOG16332.1 SEC-C domain-containing protein [Syntrophales bacterium]
MNKRTSAATAADSDTGKKKPLLRKVWDYLNGTGPKDEPAPLGRNDLCWCGSGLKYKRCHIEEDDRKRRKRAGNLI